MPKKPTEISGRFGKLTVIHCNLPPRKRILVRCDCGKEFATCSYDLLNERTKSCGNTECSTRYNDLTGKQFNCLYVNKISDKNNRGEIMWNCSCECGNSIDVKANNLTKGFVKSCGCKTYEISSLARTKPIRLVAVKSILYGYKNNAKNRKLDFNLSKKQFTELIFQNCFYCGSGLSNVFTIKHSLGDRKLIYNGIDRVNSDKGYIKNNCVTCCKICNTAKSDMSTADFFNWIKSVYNHSLN